jgi:hypothetical protein
MQKLEERGYHTIISTGTVAFEEITNPPLLVYRIVSGFVEVSQFNIQA